MPHIDPQIILRADIFQPQRVPPEIEATFERLVNFYIPIVGANIAIDFFETGWILYFGNVSDFRLFFSRPLFSNGLHSGEIKPEEPSDARDAIVWDYKFSRFPANTPVEKLVKIVSRFYARAGNLGGGSAEVLTAKNGETIVRVRRPSLAEYVNSAKNLVKDAHKFLVKSEWKFYRKI
jgi:hypothetical protein